MIRYEKFGMYSRFEIGLEMSHIIPILNHLIIQESRLTIQYGILTLSQLFIYISLQV